jgi:hypothetical protein
VPRFAIRVRKQDYKKTDQFIALVACFKNNSGIKSNSRKISIFVATVVIERNLVIYKKNQRVQSIASVPLTSACSTCQREKV